jgi:hypothetical protein
VGRRRRLDRIVHGSPHTQAQQARERRERHQRLEEFSQRHNEQMIAEHGEVWKEKQDALFAEWQLVMELHGPDSDEAIKKGQRAALFRREGIDRGLR